VGNVLKNQEFQPSRWFDVFVLFLILRRATGAGPLVQDVIPEHHQYSRSRAPVNVRADQGTHTTLFHRGFARRQQAHIHAEAPRLAHEAALQDRGALNAAGRRQRLAELNGYNGFNLISGVFDPKGIRRAMAGLQGTHSYDAGFVSGAKATGMHPHMHTVGGPDDPGEQARYPELNGPTPLVAFRSYPGSRLLPAVARDGANALAQSHFRFFRPAPTGPQQDARQTTLVLEGGGPSHPLAAGGGNGEARTNVSGVIGTFRWMDRLPSHGVEDQFSKSGYGKDAHEYSDGYDNNGGGMPGGGNSISARGSEQPYFGLAETRQPGLYTPRKQAERLRNLAAHQQASYEEFLYLQQQPQQQQQPPQTGRSGSGGYGYSARGPFESGRQSARLSSRLESGQQSTRAAPGSAPQSARATAYAHPAAPQRMVGFAQPQASARGTAQGSARGAAAARSARESDIASVRAL
jgi:hypothetical protein